MVKSLFDLSLSVISAHAVSERLVDLPPECKQRLLEFLASHDQLSIPDCMRVLVTPSFGLNLTRLNFYLSEQITDEALGALTALNKGFEVITLIECSRITDKGIQAVTREQRRLAVLELRAMRRLTSKALIQIKSPALRSVDLSACSGINSDGISQLVLENPCIVALYLNSCTGLDDRALYDIARYCAERLVVLELDFLPQLEEPASTLLHVSSLCPNLKQLSLCRFFSEVEGEEDPDSPYRIEGLALREVDLYGNFFTTMPVLPPSVTSLRLSVSGDEDPLELVRSLEGQPQLASINLQLTCRDADLNSIDRANALLEAVLLYLGPKIRILQISVPRVFDTSLTLLNECLPNLHTLALAVKHLNNRLLQRLFLGPHSVGSRLRSLKINSLRITYRVLFAIARGAKSLTDLETSHMLSVDDRFLSILADNCHNLRSVNFNGCRFVSDKGMAALARRCPLREVRIRATGCTDGSVYQLAQHCPQLEWISHADFSGRPKFSDAALQTLRDSCIQRVIC